MISRFPLPRLALCFVGLLLPASAASGRDAGRTLLDAGKARFDHADFDRSLKLLQRARRRTADPALLGEIHLYLGLNHAVRGRQAAATTEFVKALTYDPRVDLEPQRVSRTIFALWLEARAKVTGAILIEADRPGAVFVDGRHLGETPHTATVPVGARRVRVVAADGAAIEETLIVRVGQQARFVARLPDRARPRAIRAPPPPPPAALLPPAREHTDRQPAARPIYRRWWFWAAVGVAAAAAGVTAALTTGGDNWKPSGPSFTPDTYHEP